MGAINQAFNQAVGATAGAALAIKHAQESDFSKMNTAEHSALVARNQSREADAAANAATNEAKKSKLSLRLTEAETNEAEAKKAWAESMNSENFSPENMFKRYTELEAAKEAANRLRDKYQAVKDLRDRAEEQRAFADKATKNALKEQQKYQSKWGGK